jgi:hypothetical protein
MTRTHLEAIVRWLNDLSTLAPSAKAQDLTARIAGMSAMAAESFPIEAFTHASLQHAATKLNFFPSYAELVKVLEPWWKENQPVKALPFDPDGLTDEDRAIVRNFERHCANDWGKTIPLRTDLALYRELTRYRGRKRVFEYLIEHNDTARQIAQRSGWIVSRKAAASTVTPEIRRGPPLDDDPDA